MRPKAISAFRQTGRTGSGVTFAGPGGEFWSIEALEPWLFRLRFLPEGMPRCPRTWTMLGTRCREGLAGVLERDVPLEGRPRDDLSVFSLPPVSIGDSGDGRMRLAVHEGPLAAEIDPAAGRIVWRDGEGRKIAADLSGRAWVRDLSGRSVWHYLERAEGESYLGFGEVSGALNKAGRRIIMRPMDALGYDAENGGPLYKHWPFYITIPSGAAPAYGLFYDNPASCEFDLGREIDAYHGPYRYVRFDDGDIDCYIVYGPRLRDVVRRFSFLIGRPKVPPRWSLGYLGSSMAYADAPDAQQQLDKFLRLCSEHGIPCHGFHLSSGYTLGADGRRYVFTWNRERFPDPEAMVRDFHSAGKRLIANVKPCLLNDHPAYPGVAAFGGFIRAAGTDEPELNAFWDGMGSYLDFTNPLTLRWWRQELTRQLFDKGIDSAWNDNNEFEVWDDDAVCAGFGFPLRMGLARTLQPMLMARSSGDAQDAHAPEERSFSITRSASPGSQRYAWTWSGDNSAGWKTLRWSIPMGLGLGLSGFALNGHDVGGFYGPAPDAELFLRWIEIGVLHPRFSIHSWQEDGTSNEPWMYPDALPHVRKAIELRYRMIPYLYSLAFAASREGDPMLRPLEYEFPDDPACRGSDMEFMLGPALLAAAVLEPGARTRRLRLPSGSSWCSLEDGHWHAGGSEIEVAAPMGTPILLGREGAFVPLADNPAAVLGGGERPGFPGGGYGEITVLVFPPETGEGTFNLIEDDGVSRDYLAGAWNEYRLEVNALPGGIRLTAMATHSDWPPRRDRIVFALPPGETRRVKTGAELEPDGRGRRRIEIPVVEARIDATPIP